MAFATAIWVTPPGYRFPEARRAVMAETDHSHGAAMPKTEMAAHFDDAPDPYSITSSAVNINLAGTVSPIALAVLRLMIRSNLVGCSTGSSEGFSPFRIFPA